MNNELGLDMKAIYARIVTLCNNTLNDGDDYYESQREKTGVTREQHDSRLREIARQAKAALEATE